MSDRDALEKKDGICKSMAQVGIPLFFYISGMSSSFFNSKKNDYRAYLVAKVKRLLVPLVLSIVFLLIPRLYLSQEYEPWTRIDPEKEPEWDFLVFFVKILPQTPNKLSWLWFLLVLFLVFIINYPIIVWTQRRARQEPLCLKSDGQILMLGTFSLLVWAMICVVMVGGDLEQKDAIYLLGSIKILAAYLLFMAVVQFTFGNKYGHILTFWLKGAGPLCCCVMNVFKYGQWENSMYGFLISINYFIVFHTQGIFD